jgi:aminopeptidase YwaD
MSGARADAPAISTPGALKAELDGVVCKQGEREAAVVSLFEKMGAGPQEITIEKPNGIHNVVVRKAGMSEETIIIGAHYDKASHGCGAIDNWSGVVALANIYRSLRNLQTQKTLEFVAFGEEERGLLGSKAMAGKLSKEQMARTSAMVNLDSFGMGNVQAATNLSSPKLLELASTLAARLQIRFETAPIAGDSDSSPFRNRKIPAITLHGMAGEWWKTLHSENDRAEAVNLQSVYLGYRLGLLMVLEIDQAPLDKWR